MIEAEGAIISNLLMDSSLIMDCDLSGDEFSNNSYKIIYDCIKKVISDQKPVDVITVADELERETSKDWLSILTDIVTNQVSSSRNFKAYCEVVKQSHLTRGAQNIAAWLHDNANDESAVNDAIRQLMELGKASQKYDHSLNDAVKIGLKAIESAFENKGEIIGIPTGIESLDEALGGFHDSDLIVIGARPAMGKTALLLNFIANSGQAVGMISGEQGVGQIIQRYISIKSKVPLMSMRNGKLQDDDWSNLANGVTLIKSSQDTGTNIRFFDKPSPSISDIESIARRWKHEHGIKALYVDYLQKMDRDKSKSKSEAVGDNIAALKTLARELNIPIIVLAQVSREVEKRPNKRPNMGDLSDSSEIEKEADNIIMIYRDEVYNEDTTDKGVMELILEKNRHGATGTMLASWDGRYLEVSNLKWEPKSYAESYARQ